MAVLSTVFTADGGSGRRSRPGWRLAAYLAALVALFVPLALAGRPSKPAHLMYVRPGGPDWGLGHHGGVELLYLLPSALLFGGYGLRTRGRAGVIR
jgi:hypothetical protein